MANDANRRAAEELKRSMIEAIETYFEQRLEVDETQADKAQRSVNIAAAALLIETTRADHEISDDERIAVTRAVQKALGLSGGETAELIRLAEQQVRESIPIHEFTRLVERRFTRDQKLQLVQALWQVAFSDAELKAHEEYLVRKVAELINLSRADLIEAKIRAREAFR
jgi:uncharacterized tellurite resistance protein B-like protein